MDNHELELRALYYKAIDDYRSKEEEKHDEGFLFLSEAAEKGMVEACKLLGILYTSGQYDPYPAKDAKKAIGLYKQAADQGDEEAMYWLSQCYEMGLGVDKDPTEAAAWREMALDHGFVPTEGETNEKPDDVKNTDTAPASMVVTGVEVISVEDGPSEGQEDLPEDAEGHLEEGAAKAAEEEEGTEPSKEEPAPKALSSQKEEEEDIPFPKAEEKPKEKTFEDKLQEKLAKEKEQQEQEDKAQKGRYMLIAGSVLFGLSMILSLVVFVIISGLLPEGRARLYWLIAIALVLVVTGLGIFYGYKRALLKIQKAAEYRKTVFYETFGGTFGHLTPEMNWNYRIYRTLEKLYKPISYRTPIEVKKKGVGLMACGWRFKTKRGTSMPDFVILTPKSLYVVDSIGIKGRVMGDLMGYDWTLYIDGDKDQGQTTAKVENGIEKLKTNMQAVRSSLQLLTPLPIERIPVTGILAVSPETDIKGLRVAGAGENVSVVQGSPDKLRMHMAMRDRSLAEHGIDLEELAKVLEQIGKRQLD